MPNGSIQFAFPQPQATGTVTVAWAASHGITDAAPVPNPFAGGAWTYTLDTNLPVANFAITEFLASNVRTNGLRDEDGELQEWIEIRNQGTTPANLVNWSLSDDPALPGLWTFPPRTLQGGEFLVVFASGKNRAVAGAPLHANFSLNADRGVGGPENDTARRMRVASFLCPSDTTSEFDTPEQSPINYMMSVGTRHS